MTQQTETCENCGRVIGKLETPQIWKDNVVCSDCLDRLRNSRTPGTASRIPSDYGRSPAAAKSGTHPLVILCCVVFLIGIGALVLLVVASAIQGNAQLSKARATANRVKLESTMRLLMTEVTMPDPEEDELKNTRQMAIDGAEEYRLNPEYVNQTGMWKTPEEFKQRLDLAERAAKQIDTSVIDVFQPNAGLEHPELIK